MRDRAGIYDAKISRGFLLCILVANSAQPLADQLGLVLIDLATERDGFEGQGHDDDPENKSEREQL
jgi:hypothetical protein